MAQIEAVLFDYGLVLTAKPDPAARLRMEHLLHANSSAFDAAYWRERDGYDRGILTAEAYWRGVAAELSQTLDDRTLHGLIEADIAHWLRPNPEMIAWAEQLQRAGIPTGILSNLGDAMEAGLRRELPWLAGFAHTTFSHRLGMAKPDPDIYHKAAEGLRVSANRVLFIDDKPENIAGARHVGMTALQYTCHSQFVEDMATAGLEWLLSPTAKGPS